MKRMTPQEIEKQLLPCPFCGSPARVSWVRKVRTGHVIRIRGKYYGIGCTDHDCILFSDGNRGRLVFATGSPDVIIKRWNHRRPGVME